MSDWTSRIDQLDLSLFEAIPSQTSPEDRRSLLAVQSATARKYKQYTYLEIGSHLGGSIQPHLVDDRCKRIFSIDPRPSQLPDDRAPGFILHYDNNSSERMLNLLRNIGHGNVEKIECYDADASKVDAGRMSDRPQIVFIDGEHTQAACLSDFRFCCKIVDDDGTILFHDFSIVYRAIAQICGILKEQHRRHVPLKLEGEVFAIFFDPKMVREDPYLATLYERNREFLLIWRTREWLKESLPSPLLKGIRWVRAILRRTAKQGAATDC